MRRAVIGGVLILAAGLAGGAAFYGSVFHEEPLAKGELFEALVQASEGGEDNLTQVFAPFVAADAPLEGSRYCQGFFYFSYQTASGEIIETLGTEYDARERANAFGLCDNRRNDLNDLKQ